MWVLKGNNKAEPSSPTPSSFFFRSLVIWKKVCKCAYVCYQHSCVHFPGFRLKAVVDAWSDIWSHKWQIWLPILLPPVFEKQLWWQWRVAASFFLTVSSSHLTEMTISMIIKQLHKCTWKTKFQTKCVISCVGKMYNICKCVRIHSSKYRKVQSLRMLL